MKFTYKDKVQVTSGFYKGMKGEVREMKEEKSFFGLVTKKHYLLILEDASMVTYSIEPEANLELVHEVKVGKDVLSLTKKGKV